MGAALTEINLNLPFIAVLRYFLLDNFQQSSQSGSPLILGGTLGLPGAALGVCAAEHRGKGNPGPCTKEGLLPWFSSLGTTCPAGNVELNLGIVATVELPTVWGLGEVQPSESAASEHLAR